MHFRGHHEGDSYTAHSGATTAINHIGRKCIYYCFQYYLLKLSLETTSAAITFY